MKWLRKAAKQSDAYAMETAKVRPERERALIEGPAEHREGWIASAGTRTAGVRKDRPLADGLANGSNRPFADLPVDLMNGRIAQKRKQVKSTRSDNSRAMFDYPKRCGRALHSLLYRGLNLTVGA